MDEELGTNLGGDNWHLAAAVPESGDFPHPATVDHTPAAGVPVYGQDGMRLLETEQHGQRHVPPNTRRNRSECIRRVLVGILIGQSILLAVVAGVAGLVYWLNMKNDGIRLSSPSNPVISPDSMASDNDSSKPSTTPARTLNRHLEPAEESALTCLCTPGDAVSRSKAFLNECWNVQWDGDCLNMSSCRIPLSDGLYKCYCDPVIQKLSGTESLMDELFTSPYFGSFATVCHT